MSIDMQTMHKDELAPFSPEVKSLFAKYQEEMRHLAFHRKRQDEKNYWATWTRVLEIKAKFREMNQGESWD